MWDACTNPERLPRWFMSLGGDLRLGGSYEMGGFAGGEILQCDAPRLVTVSWEVEGYPVDEVELRLSEAPGGGTALRWSTPRRRIPTPPAQHGQRLGAGTGRARPGAARQMHGTLDIHEFRGRPEIEVVIERARIAWTELAHG